MSSWHSYPSIFNVGHKQARVLDGCAVNVEEKVDGSQISFGVIGGALRVRSKGQELVLDHPPGMFTEAVTQIALLAPSLTPEWTYRGEYLRVPKHNHLAYSRTPVHHIILFDVNDDEESYLSYEAKRDEAARIGLEVVPLLHHGVLSGPDELVELLGSESVLGGVKIEGFVIKPSSYAVFGPDKKVVMAKHVSAEFRESQKVSFRADNPSTGDIVATIGASLCTEARWRKSIQHARDNGTLDNSPKDIGALLKMIESDVRAEESDAIKDALFRYAWPHLKRHVVRGFPEWYKDQLLRSVGGGE